MTDVVVIGGGISGLSAAWTLARAGRSVLLLEAAAQLGGKLRSAEVAGVAVDVGAEAVLVRRPEAVRLFDELGLSGSTLAPLSTAAQLRVGGGLHPLPARTLMGIPADVEAARRSGALSEHAVGRIAAEPSLPPVPPLDEDVAVGALVRERLGNEITDRLVEPLLGGVYAGRADALSLRATVPGLARALAGGGSLVEAARTLMPSGSTRPADGPLFASLPGGLGRLPGLIAGSGAFAVRTGVTVRSVRRTPAGFAVDCGPVPAPERIEAAGLVVATPPAKAARLLAEVAPTAARVLGAVESASMAVITLAYPPGTALPAGSGLLVGVREGFAVKGVTLTSQKWPLGEGGPVLLRASVGRAGDAQQLQRSDEELVTLVRHELGRLIGLDAVPVDTLVTRWGGGLPQYGVGHVERVARVREAVAAVPGLAVCGAVLDGVGIPACIGTGRAAAERLLTGRVGD